jgi:hypothetical protein
LTICYNIEIWKSNDIIRIYNHLNYLTNTFLILGWPGPSFARFEACLFKGLFGAVSGSPAVPLTSDCTGSGYLSVGSPSMKCYINNISVKAIIIVEFIIHVYSILTSFMAG